MHLHWVIAIKLVAAPRYHNFCIRYQCGSSKGILGPQVALRLERHEFDALPEDTAQLFPSSLRIPYEEIAPANIGASSDGAVTPRTACRRPRAISYAGRHLARGGAFRSKPAAIASARLTKSSQKMRADLEASAQIQHSGAKGTGSRAINYPRSLRRSLCRSRKSVCSSSFVRSMIFALVCNVSCQRGGGRS